MSVDRRHRIWSQAGLQLPGRWLRRRVGLEITTCPAIAAIQVRAHDFMYESCAGGPQPQRLTVIDEHTRESLASDIAGIICSGWIIDVLTRLVGTKINTALIAPGK
jgi:putative transposase